MIVDIVLKADQKTGKLTRGIVADILTSDSFHHRGIKVRLKDGQVGRVQVVYPVKYRKAVISTPPKLFDRVNPYKTIDGVEHLEGLT
jgi:uncharacterized repeat protein (TIGR03833 family)